MRVCDRCKTPLKGINYYTVDIIENRVNNDDIFPRKTDELDMCKSCLQQIIIMQDVERGEVARRKKGVVINNIDVVIDAAPSEEAKKETDGAEKKETEKKTEKPADKDKPKKRRRLTDEDKKLIIADYRAGKEVYLIATDRNRGPKTIYSVLRDYDVPLRCPRGPEPEAPQMDFENLTRDQRGKIIALYNAGWKIKDIAGDTKISEDIVAAYIKARIKAKQKKEAENG